MPSKNSYFRKFFLCKRGDMASSSSAASVLLSDAFRQRLQVEGKLRCQKVMTMCTLMQIKVIGKESTPNVIAAILQAANNDANVEAFFMKTWADCDACRPESSKRMLESGDVKPDWQDGEIDPV